LLSRFVGLAIVQIGDLSQPIPLLGYHPPVPPLQWIRCPLRIAEALLGFLTVADSVEHRITQKQKCRWHESDMEKAKATTVALEPSIENPDPQGLSASRESLGSACRSTVAGLSDSAIGFPQFGFFSPEVAFAGTSPIGSLRALSSFLATNPPQLWEEITFAVWAQDCSVGVRAMASADLFLLVGEVFFFATLVVLPLVNLLIKTRMRWA
jgi:hypothetical protein